MNRKKRIFLFICCALGILGILAFPAINQKCREFAAKWHVASLLSERGADMRRFYVSDGYQSPDAYIAHGGGIGEFTYTNSLEAVQDSLKKGFRFIELDLSETSDGHILGAHDWKHFNSLTNGNNASGLPLSLDEAKNLKINGKYTVLTGDAIRELMNSNQFILVTDKIRNYKLLLEEIPFPERIIVEVFSPYEYYKALEAGIKYPAYCIWDKKCLETAIDYKFPIVTMDAGNFFENEDDMAAVRKLHDAGVTILLFYNAFSRRDAPEFVKRHVGKTVSKVYTDTWAPTALPDAAR